jgi:pseudouridine synthase
VRIQKLLAKAGIGSRRKCEEYILQGRVQVNQQIVEPGCKVDPKTDIISFDGRIISAVPAPVYIMLNKPPGVISSLRVRPGEQGLLDLVRIKDRIYPIGRLDKESQGLILLTNDGDMTHRLTHPRYGHEREYRVLVKGSISNRELSKWRQGVMLEPGVKTAPAKVWIISSEAAKTWMGVVLREGRKRQIRRVAEGLNLSVVRLIRVRIGPIELGDLAEGCWRYLTENEIQSLVQTTKTDQD